METIFIEKHMKKKYSKMQQQSTRNSISIFEGKFVIKINTMY